MKVAIIGAGAVGAACLTALVMRGCASEIIVIDRTPEKARGLVTDVQYGASLSPSVAIRAGDYSDLKGAALMMITAGVNEKTGGATDRGDPAGRLRLLDTNVGVYRDVISRLDAVEPEAMVLVVTDPPDPLADAARMMGHGRVLSTGTYLDSLRFRSTWPAGSASVPIRSRRRCWENTVPPKCSYGLRPVSPACRSRRC